MALIINKIKFFISKISNSKIKCSLVVCLFSFFLSQAQQTKPIGTNLDGIYDYSTELAFTDAFKSARTWGNFSGPNGFPSAGQTASALLLWDLPVVAFPSGDYRLVVEGTGRVTVNANGVNETYNTPINTIVQNITGTGSGGITITINETNASDPISNIKFILPDYVDSYQSKTFTDEFLDYLNDFGCIRFMDWLRTNETRVASWSDRTAKDWYTQAVESGIAWEHIIEISNLLKKDLWINIPHLAEDNYIEGLAAMLETEVDSNLKIYLEYSNEVWNSVFDQYYDVASLATDLGYTGEDWVKNYKYVAKRSADIFQIFENEFTDDSRLIKVLPSFAAVPWVSTQIIGYFNDTQYNPTAVEADAIAIAPYFGHSVADDIVNQGLVSSITPAEIIDMAEATIPNTYTNINDHKSIADNNNLELFSYEGGQHIVAVNGNNLNNNELTQKLIAANRHPDMQDVYCNYFDYWYDTIGAGMFANYTSHSSYSRWGSWGVKEYLDDVNNPKYLALENCVFSSNSSLSVHTIDQDLDHFKIYPNPSKDGLFSIKSTQSEPIEQVKLFNYLGQKIDVTIDFETALKGHFFIENQGIFIMQINGKSHILVNLN